jgi:acyl-CoA synthetase (AMP-forming)/AMP-acid ligase II
VPERTKEATADEEFRSIPAMALASAERFGDGTAVIDGDDRMSFVDVADEMLRVARALVANGIEPGDRVALWAPNSARWITSALGILAAGATLVPVNTRFKGIEAAYVLRKTDASAVLAAGALGSQPVAMVRAVDADVPALAASVSLDSALDDGTMSWEEFLADGDAVAESVVRARIDGIAPEDMCDILFTSGTTGHPKGVMLRHGTSLRAYTAFNDTFGLREGDELLVALPFFHCFGYKAGWMIALKVGATTIPMAIFDPATALREVERHRITHLGGSPTLFWALLNDPSFPSTDVSSMRVAVVSAAYVPKELVDRMQDELGLAYTMTGYGLTEAHAICTTSSPDDTVETVATWSGRPLAGVEVRIVDAEGADVPFGEPGEILVRGYTVSNGYYDEPEANAAVFDADGWLHTGDIGYGGPDRNIKVSDRKKDMFIVGGFNVAPAEVESMLVEWDRIAMVAVVGTPDERYGEVGVAFVVPAAGEALTSDEVIAYARETMANYKVPRRVEIVEALPLNATGKVLKDELRALLATSP